MKICYLNPTILLRRPIAELSTRLAEDKDNNIAILTPKRLFRKVDDSLHHKVKNVKIYSYSVINPPFLSSEWPIPITPMFFINLFRVFINYDNLHIWTYFYLSSVKALFLKRLLFWKKKTVLTMDTIPGFSFDMPGLTNKAMKLYANLFGWLIFRLPDKITLYGNSLKKHAKKVNMPMKKVEVIPTGINISKFKGSYKDVRKELDIKKEETMIVFVGLIVPRKGVDIVIDVIEKLNSQDVKMVFVGDGPDRKRYEREVKEKGIDKTIIFTGWRKDVKDIYKSADILFFPSRGEGLAGVIMEAMASKLPTISSKISCTTDLIEDNRSGFLCENENGKEYLEKLKKLITSKDLREKFGKEAEKKIEEFRWKNVIGRYKELYHK